MQEDNALIFDPAKVFGDVAKVYNQIRPEYPRSQATKLLAELGLGKDATVADVGAGTCKLSAAFAGQVGNIICVDPDANMLTQGRKTMEAQATGQPYERKVGPADATGLSDKSVDLIVVGNAVHWFNKEAALPEFNRILKDDGKIGIFFYHLDTKHPVTQALDTALKIHCPHYADLGQPKLMPPDEEMRRNTGEEFIDMTPAKFTRTEVATDHTWNRDNLYAFLCSFGTTASWAQQNKIEVDRTVIEPLFARFSPDQNNIQVQWTSALLQGGLHKVEPLITKRAYSHPSQ